VHIRASSYYSGKIGRRMACGGSATEGTTEKRKGCLHWKRARDDGADEGKLII